MTASDSASPGLRYECPACFVAVTDTDGIGDRDELKRMMRDHTERYHGGTAANMFDEDVAHDGSSDAQPEQRTTSVGRASAATEEGVSPPLASEQHPAPAADESSPGEPPHLDLGRYRRDRPKASPPWSHDDAGTDAVRAIRTLRFRTMLRGHGNPDSEEFYHSPAGAREILDALRQVGWGPASTQLDTNEVLDSASDDEELLRAVLYDLECWERSFPQTADAHGLDENTTAQLIARLRRRLGEGVSSGTDTLET